MSQSPKQLAAAQRRRLATIQRSLEAMAAEWGDVDAFNESELHTLAEQAKSVAEGLVAESRKESP